MVLEIKASGMCGSDLHNYRAPAQPGGRGDRAASGAQAGVIAGHEPCGVVAAVGTGVTEKEARVGQRVMDHHYDGCGTCKHCRAGWTQMCLEGTVVYGSGGHGGHARYMKVPVSTLVPLPDALSFVDGRRHLLRHRHRVGRAQAASTCRAARPSPSSARGRWACRRRSSRWPWARA